MEGHHNLSRLTVVLSLRALENYPLLHKQPTEVNLSHNLTVDLLEAHHSLNPPTGVVHPKVLVLHLPQLSHLTEEHQLVL